MTDHISTEKGFMDHFVEGRVDPEGFLSRIDRLVDWSPIERLLKKYYIKTAAADGRPAYPGLTMFKILLARRWYGLSDAGMLSNRERQALFFPTGPCRVQGYLRSRRLAASL